MVILCVFPLTGCAQDLAEWHMVNVNSTSQQGDAHVLKINGTVVMIDAGRHNESRKNLIPYLRKIGIRRVHHMYISHPHQDHYDGVTDMVNDGIKIDNLYYRVPPDGASGCCYFKSDFIKHMNKVRNAGALTHLPQTGDVLELPNGSRIEILYVHEGINWGHNDRSLIMRWHIGSWSVLFTGDLSKNLGTWLINNVDVSADIIKVPHHGGRAIAPKEFFDAVDANFALISGPQWIWCGERGTIARSWIEANTVVHWLNGIDGHVKIDFGRTDMHVTGTSTHKGCKDRLWANGIYRNKRASIVPIINLLFN